MTSRVNEIDLEISKLKEQLLKVEGSETEVYARIVGYYRAVKNWNIGKKEEYKERIPFSQIEKETVLSEVISVITGKALSSHQALNPDVIASFTYFYSRSCPNCPAMTNALNQLAFVGEELNVDNEAGLEAASQNLVFTAPTVIFKTAEGVEVFRTSHPGDVLKQFNLKSVSA